MKIFITGAQSFVGKEFIRQCDDEGYELVGCDITDSTDNRFHQVDICSKDLADIVPTDVDAVIHFAAMSTDKLCAGRMFECFDKNVMGTINVVDTAEKRGSKKFIFASTEWVYDSFSDGVEKTEESIIDISQINSEYALSKLVSEANLRQRYSQGFCDTAILRFGIIYGRRSTNWSAVEAIFNSVKEKRMVEVGSLRSGRHFIHVQDIANGVKQSLNLKGFNILNLQGERLITLGELIEVSKSILGVEVIVRELEDAKYDIRPLSNNLAKRLLEWAPKVELENGLLDFNKYLENGDNESRVNVE